MPRCGCAGGSACACSFSVLDTDTIDLTLIGNGSIGNPYTISADLIPNPGQPLYITVAAANTAEPFRSSADFICDGTADQVEIQAAIDQAVSLTVLPRVLLFPGSYAVSTSMDTKGVSIFGQNPLNTFGGDVIITASVGVRVFDNQTGPLLIENLLIFASGAAVLFVDASGGSVIRGCGIVGGDGAGDDAHCAVFEGLTTSAVIIESGFNRGGGAGVGYGVVIRDTFSRIDITHCTFEEGFALLNCSIGGGIVTNNNFRFSDVPDSIHIEDSERIIISNNYLHGSRREGIVLIDSSFNQIFNNSIRYQVAQNSILEDGIRLSGNSDQNMIQGNYIRATGGFGRHGINIEAATCNDNMVTNNDLFLSGAGTSINDAGTATITAAGNRL